MPILGQNASSAFLILGVQLQNAVKNQVHPKIALKNISLNAKVCFTYLVCKMCKLDRSYNTNNRLALDQYALNNKGRGTRPLFLILRGSLLRFKIFVKDNFILLRASIFCLTLFR